MQNMQKATKKRNIENWIQENEKVDCKASTNVANQCLNIWHFGILSIVSVITNGFLCAGFRLFYCDFQLFQKISLFQKVFSDLWCFGNIGN